MINMNDVIKFKGSDGTRYFIPVTSVANIFVIGNYVTLEFKQEFNTDNLTIKNSHVGNFLNEFLKRGFDKNKIKGVARDD